MLSYPTPRFGPINARNHSLNMLFPNVLWDSSWPFLTCHHSASLLIVIIQLGRYDKALQIILSNMEGEQRISVRQANARHLPSFIVAMGITILWHIKVFTSIHHFNFTTKENKKQKKCLICDVIKNLFDTKPKFMYTFSPTEPNVKNCMYWFF